MDQSEPNPNVWIVNPGADLWISVKYWGERDILPHQSGRVWTCSVLVGNPTISISYKGPINHPPVDDSAQRQSFYWRLQGSSGCLRTPYSALSRRKVGWLFSCWSSTTFGGVESVIWATKKKRPYLPWNTRCLIAIPIMVAYNPLITG